MISRGETEHTCADGARSGQEGVENPGRRSQSPRLSSRRVVDRKIEQEEEEEDAWFKRQVVKVQLAFLSSPFHFPFRPAAAAQPNQIDRRLHPSIPPRPAPVAHPDVRACSTCVPIPPARPGRPIPIVLFISPCRLRTWLYLPDSYSLLVASSPYHTTPLTTSIYTCPIPLQLCSLQPSPSISQLVS